MMMRHFLVLALYVFILQFLVGSSYHVVKLSPHLQRGKKVSNGATVLLTDVEVVDQDNLDNFPKANWDGWNRWDWLGVWKDDPAHPEEGCVDTPGTGWTCPFDHLYTSGKDYVPWHAEGKTAAKILNFVKPLTPTRRDRTDAHDKYHLYYCLTPWTSMVRSDFECIARTDFYMPSVQSVEETDSALLTAVDSVVSITLNQPEHVPNNGDRAVVAKFEIVDDNWSLSSSDFIGVWKIRGDDQGCTKLEASETDDHASFECNSEKLWTKLDGAYNNPILDERTLALSWDRSATLDRRAGYAVFYCKTPYFLMFRKQYRCFGRSALFVPSSHSTARSGKDILDVMVDKKITDMLTCGNPPPAEPGIFSRAAHVARNLAEQSGGRIAQGIRALMPSAEKPSIQALKTTYFADYSNVLDLYGVIIGYGSIRISDISGQIRASLKDDAFVLDVFNARHADTNLVDVSSDCRSGHTSVMSLELTLVDWKIMSVAEPSKVVGSNSLTVRIEVGVSARATYSQTHEEEAFFEELVPTEVRPEARPSHNFGETRESFNVGDLVNVDLDGHDEAFLGQVIAKRGNLYDVKFSNGVKRKGLRFEALSELSNTAWHVNDDDVKVCVTNVDILNEGNAFGSGASSTNVAFHAVTSVANMLGSGNRKRLFDTFITQELRRQIFCALSGGLKESIGTHLTTLARAAKYADQLILMTKRCRDSPERAGCPGSIEALNARLSKMESNPHSLDVNVKVGLQNRGKPTERLSAIVDFDLDTSSAGLIQMAVQPLLDTMKKENSDQDETPASTLRFLSSQSREHIRAGAATHAKRKGRAQTPRPRRLRSGRHILSTSSSVAIARDGSIQASTVDVENPLSDLYRQLKTDLHNLAAAAAKANDKSHGMLQMMGNFILNTGTDIDVTFKGGVEINPPQDGSIMCTAAEQCVPIAKAQVEKLTTSLKVPESHKIAVPLRWAVLEQPFGDLSFEDNEDWQKAFEYYGSLGWDVDGMDFRGPLKHVIDIALKQLRSGETSQSPSESTVPSTKNHDDDDDDFVADTVVSGADALLDGGASFALETGGGKGSDKGVHVDKENLNTHLTLVFKGPSNMDRLIRWGLDKVAEAEEAAKAWARKQLRERREKGNALIDATRALQREASRRENLVEHERFLEKDASTLTSPSPCNEVVPRGLGRYDECVTCVNTKGGTWKRNWPMKNVVYTGCYWLKDEKQGKQCRMVSESRTRNDAKAIRSTTGCERAYETASDVERRRPESNPHDGTTSPEEVELEVEESDPSYDPVVIANMISTARGKASMQGRTISGDACVREVEEVLKPPQHQDFVPVIARAACIRAAAIRKLKDGIPSKKIRPQGDEFPTGKMPTHASIGPIFTPESDKNVVERAKYDWVNFLVEGMGPLCGLPSAVSGSGAARRHQRPHAEENCKNLYSFYENTLKMKKSGLFSRMTQPYVEIQLCSGDYTGLRLTLSTAKTFEDASKKDAFKKRYLMRDLSTVDVQRIARGDDGMTVQIPTITIRMQEIDSETGRFLSDAPLQYELTPNNVDDYTRLRTIVKYTAVLESTAREQTSIHAEEMRDRKSLDMLEQKMKDAMDEAVAGGDDKQDLWYLDRVSPSEYPILWASGWPINYVGKLAIGVKKVTLDKADLVVQTDLHVSDDAPELRIWISSNAASGKENFDIFRSVVDACDPNLSKTKESLFTLDAVVQDGKIALNKYGGDLQVDGLKLLLRAGLYTILKWDDGAKRWSMSNEDTRICVPEGNGSDDYLKIDVDLADQRGLKGWRDGIVTKILNGESKIPFFGRLDDEVLVKMVIPILRAQLFCNLEHFLLGAADHLPEDTTQAQRDAQPTSVANILGAIASEKIRRAGEHESSLAFALELLLTNAGLSSEALRAHVSNTFQMRTESFFDALLKKSGAQEDSTSMGPKLPKIAEYIARWATKLDSSNNGITTKLFETLAKLFYAGRSDLKLATDLLVQLDMFRDARETDMITIHSNEFGVKGRADNIPVPLKSLVGAAEVLHDAIGLSDARPLQVPGFRLNMDSLKVGATPLHLHGPAMGTLLSARNAICVAPSPSDAPTATTSSTTKAESTGRSDNKLLCDFLGRMIEYLERNDVLLKLQAGSERKPGTGLFMNRDMIGSMFSGSFRGPTDIQSFLEYIIDDFLSSDEQAET